MSDIKHEVLLGSMFGLLSKEPEVKITERRSLVVGTREAGISREILSENWRRWKTETDRNGIPANEMDRETVIFMLACLVHEESLSATLRAEAALIASSARITENQLARIWELSPELAGLSFSDRVQRIGNLLATNSNSTKSSPNQDLYIANQLSEEGFDELQSLVMARHLGLHIAIDGPPGVGKTQSVIEVCKILNLPLFTKTCSSRTSESHIIAYPVLTADNGATVTSYVNGPLCLAMEQGGVFYGDEFNLLKEDVQKRMNSAFDDRRAIDRADGNMVTAQKGFWSVISYNPSNTLSSRDLENSVADRFVHLHFKRWDPDFKAWVSLAKARGLNRSSLTEKNSFGIPLSWRGIDPVRMCFYYGQRIGDRLVWRDFFTEEEVATTPPYVYLVCDQGSLVKERNEKTAKALDILAKQSYDEESLARLIARFTEILQNICTTGDAPMLKKIGLGNLREKEDLDILKLHETSTRIEMAAARQYHFLINKRCNKYLAQSYAVRLVIDQACYGQYRDRKLREVSAHTLVSNIAQSMRLMALGAQYNTSFNPEKLWTKSSNDK